MATMMYTSLLLITVVSFANNSVTGYFVGQVWQDGNKNYTMTGFNDTHYSVIENGTLHGFNYSVEIPLERFKRSSEDLSDASTANELPVMRSGHSGQKRNDIGLPRFEVLMSENMNDPPRIKVFFANGHEDEIDLKQNKFDATSVLSCNYLGNLRYSPFSSVAVTGCLKKPEDKMEITLISNHTQGRMFTVDLDGNTQSLGSSFAEAGVSRARRHKRRAQALPENGWVRIGDEMVNLQMEKDAEVAKLTTIPSKLKAVIKFGYDEGINNKLRQQGQTFEQWIEGVLTHAQAHFKHPSLGTQIEFEVQGDPIYKSGIQWTADENIKNARDATRGANLNGVDAMSWWCNSGGGSTAGIAYVGGLCSTYGTNTNLNEYQSTKSGAGFLLAHELGHNFGMRHDFHSMHGGHNGPCDRKGIMSYGSFSYDRWSACSKSDWEHHYSSLNWGNGCLEDISGISECGWMTPTNEENKLECGDGTSCDANAQGWGCCNGRSGRARCPKNFPIMCAEKKCAGGKDFCCNTSISDCLKYGGQRTCGRL